MWRIKKSWESPPHPWIKYRLDEERRLKKEYGLKNKRELWKAYTIVRKIRFYAKYLNSKRAAGFDISKEEKLFLNRLIKYGLLRENSTLSDVLNITVRDVLERRLQTLVYRKGLAKTIKQARQLIVHGHIMVGDNVITSPGYLVKKEEEEKIKYNEYSPLSNPDHPLRKFLNK
ncbi:MAG: 30S ribosomal protein S4 [Nanopusillaceae archaeon]